MGQVGPFPRIAAAERQTSSYRQCHDRDGHDHDYS